MKPQIGYQILNFFVPEILNSTIGVWAGGKSIDACGASISRTKKGAVV